MLHEALNAERAAAEAAAAALRQDMEQRYAADRATAVGDAHVEFTQRLQEQGRQHEEALARQSAQLQVL